MIRAKAVKRIKDDFGFKKRRDRIDWKSVAGLDVSSIIKSVDVDRLQNVMENIAFADMENEGFVDPNFCKLFQLAQLIIEYLLHCQSELLGERDEWQEKAEATLADNAAKTSALGLMTEERNDLKKEVKGLKKTLYAYQLMAKLPGGIGQNATTKSAVYFRCRVCPKVFAAESYLISHEERRHPDLVHDLPGTATPRQEQVSDNSAEMKRLADLIEKVADKANAKADTTEMKLAQMIQAQETNQRKGELDKEYQQFRLKFEKEVQDMKSELARQLQEERMRLEEEKEALHRIVENSVKPASWIGNIEDDDEVSRPESRQSRESPRPHISLENLKATLLSEMADLRRSLLTSTASDRMQLDERLAFAMTELHDIRDHMNQAPVPIPAPAAVSVPELVKPSPRSSFEPSPRHSKVKFAESEPDHPHVKLASPVLPKHTIQLPEPIHIHRVSFTPPPVLVQSRDDWESILDQLQNVHNKLSMPEKPWVTSHYVHPVRNIDETRSHIQLVLKEKMYDVGLDMDVLKVVSWDQGLTKVLNAETKLRHEREQLSKKPHFDKMRAYLEQQLEEYDYPKKPVVQTTRRTSMLVPVRRVSIAPRANGDTKSQVAIITQRMQRKLSGASIASNAYTIGTDYGGSPVGSPAFSQMDSPTNASPMITSPTSPVQEKPKATSTTRLTFQNALQKASRGITKRLFSTKKAKGEAALPPIPPASESELKSESTGYDTSASESPSKSGYTGSESEYTSSPSRPDTPDDLKDIPEVEEEVAIVKPFVQPVNTIGWAVEAPPRPAALPLRPEAPVLIAKEPTVSQAASADDPSFSISDISEDPTKPHEDSESSELNVDDFIDDESIKPRINTAPIYESGYIELKDRTKSGDEDLLDLLEDIDASLENVSGPQIQKVDDIDDFDE